MKDIWQQSATALAISSRRPAVTVAGKWRIIAIPDYAADYPDMLDPAYLLLLKNGSGEFAFGCVTGQIWGACDADAVTFCWQGSDEMDQTSGSGSAVLRPDGTLSGHITFQNGDEARFTARPWNSTSTHR